MPSLNRVYLSGHLGRDPETKFLPNGNAVANFSIATTERWQKDGEWKEKTEWHRITAWGKTAEMCGEVLRKGTGVFVEGRLQTRSWDKDGEKRYVTEVVAQTVWPLERIERSSDKPRGQRPDDPDEGSIPF